VRLYCVGRYRSGAGSWEPGQEVDVPDELAAFLLRDSPSSFTTDAPGQERAPSAPAPDVSDISTTTASDLTVPDRRARGGRRRTGDGE